MTRVLRSRADGDSHPPMVAGQFGWVSGGNILAAGLQAGSFILLARWTDLHDFGMVTSFLAVVVIVQTVFDFGIPTFLVRARAADPMDPNIARAIRFNNFTSWTLCGVLTSVLIALALILNDAIFLTLLPLSIWAASERNTDTRLGIVLADGNARINGASIVIRRLAAFTAFVTLHLLHLDALLAFTLGWTTTALVANFWARRLVNSLLPPDRGGRLPIADLLRNARPYWINSLSIQIRQADVLIVGLLAGTVQAAWYAAVSRTTGPLRILPTAMATVLMPATARAASAPLKRLIGPVLGVLSVVAILYTCIAITAPIVIPATLGSDYLGAVVPIQIVMGGLWFAALASLTGAILQGLSHPKDTARVNAATAALCLAGVAASAPSWGAVGAAIALSVSFAIQALLLALMLARRIHQRSVEPIHGAES